MLNIIVKLYININYFGRIPFFRIFSNYLKWTWSLKPCRKKLGNRLTSCTGRRERSCHPARPPAPGRPAQCSHPSFRQAFMYKPLSRLIQCSHTGFSKSYTHLFIHYSKWCVATYLYYNQVIFWVFLHLRYKWIKSQIIIILIKVKIRWEWLNTSIAMSS